MTLVEMDRRGFMTAIGILGVCTLLPAPVPVHPLWEGLVMVWTPGSYAIYYKDGKQIGTVTGYNAMTILRKDNNV